MKQILTVVLFMSLVTIGCSQSDNRIQKLDDETWELLYEWIDKPTQLLEKALDPEILSHFMDSGYLNNGIKDGQWKEFFLDTVVIDEDYKEIFRQKKILMRTGKYINGKKEGEWIIYQVHGDIIPLQWKIKSAVNYNAGLKHGEEVIFQGQWAGLLQPAVIRNWNDDIENGIVKVYHTYPPFELKSIYWSNKGKWSEKERYYPQGQIEIKFSDTLVEGLNLIKYLKFYEDGTLSQVGTILNSKLNGLNKTYYPNGNIEKITILKDGEFNGEFKLFHDNGQLWTERIYSNGKLLEVLSNYDREGNTKYPGDIINGTGTLFVYDALGNLEEKLKFIDGEEE